MNSWKPAAMTSVYIVLYSLLVLSVAFLCYHGYRFCYDVFADVRVEQQPGEDLPFRCLLQTVSGILRRNCRTRV